MKANLIENLKGAAFTAIVSTAIIVGYVMWDLHPQTVHAQSGTTCCKIDPVIISVDDQGNLVVYHAKGPLTLPAGSTTVYTGTSLSQALTISEDTLYAVKGSQ